MTGRASTALATLLLLCFCTGGTAVAAKSPAAHGVELVDCTGGKKASDRSATFRGAMSQLPEGQSMRLRFDLGERIGRGIWRGVAAPGLGVWQTSQPGVSRFAYNQRIAALQRGTAYRVHVTFQWLDGKGAAVAEQTLRSKACRQRGRLPNLHPRGGVSVRPGPTPDTFRYVVQVRNTGFAAARKVELRIGVDGAELDTRSIGRLRSRQARRVTFVGPACRGSVTVEADPRDTVRELTEADNVQRSPCPQSASAVPPPS